MSVLFFESALINAMIFLWIASAVSAMRIFMRTDCTMSTSLTLAILFGPLALIGSWLYEAKWINQRKPNFLALTIKSSVRSLVALVLVTLLILSSFYGIFVANYSHTTTSNDLLLRHIIIFVVIAGFLGGIILASLVGRVAFFEIVWITFIFAASGLMLTNWALEIFPFGTSSTYLVAVILTSTALLLIFLNLGGSFGYLIFGEGRLNLRFGYENFIGSRFLMTKRTSHVVSLITVISVLAVMMACAGMIVVMSVMNGFSSDLRSKILGANAHLMILKYGKDFTEYESIIDKTKNIPGIVGASAFIVNEGMVHSHKNISTSVITGIDLNTVKASGRLNYVSEEAINNLADPQKIPKVTELKKTEMDNVGDVNGAEFPGVILGKEMASELQVIVGDTVNLVSPVGDIGPSGPIPKARAFRVAGFFYSGMYEFDAKFAFIRLSDAQDFFNLKDSVTGIEYRVKDIENTRRLAKEIESTIGGYPFYARDWMQMNRNTFSALQLEKIAMLIILGTLVFMASLLILVTLIMVVMEKGKEIAILKSMGATDVSIMKIFVTYGLSVGGMGAVSGGLLGMLVCFLIEKVGIRLDPDVYYFSNLPVQIVPHEVGLVVIAAILISFLATIPPSLFAARLKPVEGLRYE